MHLRLRHAPHELVALRVVLLDRVYQRIAVEAFAVVIGVEILRRDRMKPVQVIALRP